MEYTVNNRSFKYIATNESRRGDDKILLSQDIDLTSNTNWGQLGYTIEKLFPDNTYKAFFKETAKLLMKQWAKAGLPSDQKLHLDQYHLLINDKESHLQAIEYTKLLDVKYFPIPIKLLEERISSICKTKLIAKNPFDNQTVFHFRVIRPKQTDNNPLHRDVWLEDYKDCINLYIPIAGSNSNSSLVIIPGSHLWPDANVEHTINGAEINGVKYNVPAVTKIDGDVKCIRPNPGINEVLVFSPYLIHGGAVNLNPDTTRISIEIRLWKP